MSEVAPTSEHDRLAAARAGFGALAPRVAAGEPWPLSEAFGTEPESSWGPREVLAHVVEMLPFWLGQLEKVVAGDGTSSVPFGRTADDALRIGLIERERTLPIPVLFSRIDADLAAWQTRLASLSADDRAKVGLHPRLGEMAVGAMPERFVLAHAEEHIGQLESILAAAGR